MLTCHSMVLIRNAEVEVWCEGRVVTMQMGIIRRICALYGGSDGRREEETDNGPPHLEETLKE